MRNNTKQNKKSMTRKQNFLSFSLHLLSFSKSHLPMTESAYLKDELGAVLAKGLAAVAIARPQDPVEYLGLWLLHQLQKKEQQSAELERQRQLEAEREEWAKARAVREKVATAVIQREWRAHIAETKDAERKEADLKQIFASIEETADEKVPEEPLSEGEKTEQERNTEQERLTTKQAFGKSRLFVLELNKTTVADFKKLPASNHSAMTVLKCVFYLWGLRPRQLDTPEKMKTLIKPYPFAKFIHDFQPCGSPLEKKRKIARVRRLLTTVSEEAIKDTSAALYAVYNWLSSLCAFRDARDEHIKVKRAAGKEVEEELDEEEEAEDEEKDPDEEVVKAAELEAKRQAELEAAEEAAEAEGEVPGGDGDA